MHAVLYKQSRAINTYVSFSFSFFIACSVQKNENLFAILHCDCWNEAELFWSRPALICIREITEILFVNRLAIIFVSIYL